MEKIISIVVPTYNMEGYLGRCLDSLLIDNLEDIEVLVVNDGSTDNSLDIAKKYSDRYPSVFRIIDKVNGHYGSCINVGLQEAKGKYFKILDADDYYDTDAFECLVSELSSLETDIILTPYNLIVKDEVKNKRTSPVYKSCTFKFDDIKQGDTLYDGLFNMYSIAIKPEILRKNGYKQTEGINYTDVQFSFYSLLYAEDFTICNYNVYQYCIGREGQSMSDESKLRNCNDFKTNADRMFEDYKVLKKCNMRGLYRLEKFITISLWNYLKTIHNRYGDDRVRLELQAMSDEMREFIEDKYPFLKSKLKNEKELDNYSSR